MKLLDLESDELVGRFIVGVLIVAGVGLSLAFGMLAVTALASGK